jgi:thiol-disulfide isomerase/thioredoxin
MKKHRSNTRFLPLFILVCLFSAVLASCSKDDSGAGDKGPVEAEVFKPFTIYSFEGEPINTESMIGDVVVINFWASWCGPCKMEAADIESVYKKYKKKDVRFVGIAVDDTDVNARKFIERYKLTYPNALDEYNRLAAEYQIFAVPTTFVLDRGGWNSFTHRGAISKKQLERAIKRVY